MFVELHNECDYNAYQCCIDSVSVLFVPQVMGVMPIISIEKTDGCQVYLSKESLKADIVTAKSSEMNVMIPKPDGEFVEQAIPEQFLTKVNGLSLTTTCNETC